MAKITPTTGSQPPGSTQSAGGREPDWRRPKPDRAIQVFGEFTDELGSKVISEISEFRAKGSAPITLYINSIGGSVLVLKYINGLLDSPDLDGKFVRTVTVASGTAASAGAILMALGDYAYAYQHSLIHFHGVRASELPEKLEDAVQLLNELNRTQREVSRKLSQVIIRRVAFRYQKLKSKFNCRRRDVDDRELVELRCFVDAIKQEISVRARWLAEKTFKNVEQARFLSEKILSSDLPGRSLARQDAKVLTRVVQHELREGRPKLLKIDESGIQRILADYFTIRDYNLGEHNEFLGFLMRNIGFDFLTPAQAMRYNKIKSQDAKKAQKYLWKEAFPSLEPLWFYTVSLCRLLFEGENRLTPEDAYWLGIIDEVIGTPLTGFRVVAEQQQKPLTAPSTTVPSRPTSQSATVSAATAPQP